MLKYLRNDARWEIKSHCLKALYKLAKPGAHLWPAGAIDDFIDFTLQSDQARIVTLALGMKMFEAFF